MKNGCLYFIVIWALVELISGAIIVGLYAAVAALLGWAFSWRIAIVAIIAWSLLTSLFRCAKGDKK